MSISSLAVLIDNPVAWEQLTPDCKDVRRNLQVAFRRPTTLVTKLSFLFQAPDAFGSYWS
jgi:hypothetical protein